MPVVAVAAVAAGVVLLGPVEAEAEAEVVAA